MKWMRRRLELESLVVLGEFFFSLLSFLFARSFTDFVSLSLSSQAPAHAHSHPSASPSGSGSGSRAGSAGGSTGGEGMMLDIDEDPFSEQEQDDEFAVADVGEMGEMGWVGSSGGVGGNGATGGGGSAGATMVAGEKRKRRAV